MKNCPEYRNDLAACAALGESPGHDLAAHLKSCSKCAALLNDFQRVASKHSTVSMPAPRRAPHIVAFFRRNSSAPNHQIPWRGVLAGTAAAVVFSIGFWLSRINRPPELEKQLVIAPMERFEAPTWNALRSDMDHENLRLSILAGPREQYRIKDAYTEQK